MSFQNLILFAPGMRPKSAGKLSPPDSAKRHKNHLTQRPLIPSRAHLSRITFLFSCILLSYFLLYCLLRNAVYAPHKTHCDQCIGFSFFTTQSLWALFIIYSISSNFYLAFFIMSHSHILRN